MENYTTNSFNITPFFDNYLNTTTVLLPINTSYTDVDQAVEYTDPVVNSTAPEFIIIWSLLFIVIGTVGIGGNLLVIISVMFNKKMRTSMTNLLIMNLAVADLLIMVFGVPEIVLFMRNAGWTLGEAVCKINRFILVSSLYGSILTLVALCVERYVHT